MSGFGIVASQQNPRFLLRLVSTGWAAVLWAALGWMILTDGFRRTNAQRQDLLGLGLLILAAVVAVVAVGRRPRPVTFILAALAVLPLVVLVAVILFFL